MPSLAFEPPRLIAEHAGVWMDGVQGLSATHALGAVNARSTFQFVATTDAAKPGRPVPLASWRHSLGVAGEPLQADAPGRTTRGQWAAFVTAAGPSTTLAI